METKLLCCPFCGHEAESGESVGRTGDGPLFYQAGCEACETLGPSAASVEEADRLWNQRAPLELSSGWVLMEERQPPEVGFPYLVCIDMGKRGLRIRIDVWDISHDMNADWREYSYHEVTHWMPLPPQPANFGEPD